MAIHMEHQTHVTLNGQLKSTRRLNAHMWIEINNLYC